MPADPSTKQINHGCTHSAQTTEPHTRSGHFQRNQFQHASTLPKVCRANGGLQRHQPLRCATHDDDTGTTRWQVQYSTYPEKTRLRPTMTVKPNQLRYQTYYHRPMILNGIGCTMIDATHISNDTPERVKLAQHWHLLPRQTHKKTLPFLLALLFQ